MGWGGLCVCLGMSFFQLSGSTWASLEEVSEQIEKWCVNPETRRLSRQRCEDGPPGLTPPLKCREDGRFPASTPPKHRSCSLSGSPFLDGWELGARRFPGGARALRALDARWTHRHRSIGRPPNRLELGNLRGHRVDSAGSM